MKYIIIGAVVSSLLMTGLIWFVQWVHYPLFAKVGSGDFVTYEQSHVNWTGQLVAPLMVIELIFGLCLYAKYPSDKWQVIALLLLAITWLSTFLIQVPLHNVLSVNFNKEVVAQLVKSNWIRTIAWTLKSGVLLVWLMQHITIK